MRFHDLHGDGRFSLLELRWAREQRDGKKRQREERRKARKARSWPRWLTLLGRAVRWHFREPCWSAEKQGEPERGRTCSGCGCKLVDWPYLKCPRCSPIDTDSTVRERVQVVLADLDAREVLALARGVAHRDGERQLEKVVHAVLLLDLMGALEGVAASCDAVLYQIGKEMGREPGERVH